MLRYVIMLAVILILVVALSPVVEAFPTSLSLIPTADLLDAKSIRLEYENDGYSRLFASDADDLYLLEMGITPRLEAGVDLYDCAGETDTVVNAKYQLLTEADTRPALSAGALDIGEGYRPTYYLAAAKDIGKCRLHLGAIGDRHASNLMAGCEIPLKGESYVLLDYIGGDDGYATVGAWLPMKSKTYLTVAYGFANESSNSDLFILNYAWEFSLSK